MVSSKQPRGRAPAFLCHAWKPVRWNEGILYIEPPFVRRSHQNNTPLWPEFPPKREVGTKETTSKEQSYGEVAATHLRVAAIDVQHPLDKLTGDQVEMVQNGLMGTLGRQLEQCLASEREAATFKGTKYTGEILRITCEDEVSLEWLKQTVRSLSPWEGV